MGMEKIADLIASIVVFLLPSPSGGDIEEKSLPKQEASPSGDLVITLIAIFVLFVGFIILALFA